MRTHTMFFWGPTLLREGINEYEQAGWSVRLIQPINPNFQEFAVVFEKE